MEQEQRKVEITDEEQPEQNVGEETENEEMSEAFAQLQAELERMRSDAEEVQNRYLRALADYDNFRKRQREETARQISVAREQMLCKLLPIVDNLERGLAAAEEQHSFESLLEGVTLTLRQMQEMMQREGVEPIEAVGQEFNPELHEAMMRVETSDQPENTVVDEFEKGYTFSGRVLRPSRVAVAANPE